MVNSSLIQYRALLARQHALQQQHHRRLARKIHDDVSQKLTMLALQISLAAMSQPPPANWTEKCQKWNDMVVELGSVLRDISNDLRPRILDDSGLVAALQWLASSSPEGISCKLKIPAEPVSLAPFAANEVFGLCREIVTDVFAPNGVTKMSAELEQTAEQIRIQLRVEDIKTESATLTAQALDALSIHERLACIDGAAEVDQQPGRGFTVTLSAQLARRAVSNAA